MKKFTLAISFLILAGIACNVFAGAPTNAPELLTASPTNEIILSPATFTPIVLPPTQAIQTPVFTPVPPTQPSSSNTIYFNTGGTWTDVSGRVNKDASKTYTLNASEGQIMSVSVLAGNEAGGWGYFPIEIKGNDGTVLCPVEQNTECSFWRGTLPSSQDYFITVKSGGDLTDFTLRVAINPPGKAEQLFQYNTTKVSLTYSDQFAPTLFPSTSNAKTDPQLALQFIDTKSYENTNLSEAYFLLSSSSDSQKVATCTEPNQSGGAMEEPKGSEIVNGYNFVHSQAIGAGAGNYYEQEIYRTADQGVCHEVIFFIHYTNIANYTPGTVIEFDRNALMQKFSGILSTFKIK